MRETTGCTARPSIQSGTVSIFSSAGLFIAGSSRERRFYADILCA
jgi:hypothetical protein